MPILNQSRNRDRWFFIREDATKMVADPGKKIEPALALGGRYQKQVVKMSVCESDNESVIYTCECCRQEVEENDYAGCCRDGNCPHKIENLCTDCGDWSSEMWWCPKCVQEDENNIEAPTRECVECEEDFTPSWEHDDDLVCDECVSEKGKKQILRKNGIDSFMVSLMQDMNGRMARVNSLRRSNRTRYRSKKAHEALLYYFREANRSKYYRRLWCFSRIFFLTK